jgi:hypothetical protein
MSVLALFSGLLYKGSYNVEVRRPHVSALPLSRPRARALAPEAPPPAPERAAKAQAARRPGGQRRRRSLRGAGTPLWACKATSRSRSRARAARR